MNCQTRALDLIELNRDRSILLTVIQEYDPQNLPPHASFHSVLAYRMKVGASDCDDVGNFTVISGSDVEPCTIIVSRIVQEVPLGSPEQWQAVYRAMGQSEKVRLLEAFKK